MKYVLLIALFFYFFKGNSQNFIEYHIIANNNVIGNIKVKQQIHNNIIEYSATSESSFKLFITVNLSYKLNCTYKNGILLFSSVSTYINGKLHSSATAEKTTDSTYIVKNDSHEKRIFEPITYSGAMLYFYEPKKVNKVFSEFYNNFNPLDKLDSHVYELTNTENGNKSDYYYQNGILQKAIIHHQIMTFSLEKISQ